MRTCPNNRCRLQNEDSVNQCPGCGAPMNRAPDVPADPNAHLYALRANAGMTRNSGEGGGVRRGSEPMYADTIAVKAVALELITAMGGTDV